MPSYLGTGVGFRSIYFDNFYPSKPLSIDWVEAISENYLAWEGQSRLGRRFYQLEKIRSQVPVVLHGVSLSFIESQPNTTFMFIIPTGKLPYMASFPKQSKPKDRKKSKKIILSSRIVK